MNPVVRRQWPLMALLATVLALPVVIGCGSGGSGGTSGSSIGGGGSRSPVNIYVTDAFSKDYSQVLVTLYKIEASTDGKTFQTLFSDSNGITLDLASYAGKAELVESAMIPTGTYTQVRVTIGDHITLVPKGGGSSIDAPVAAASNVVLNNGQAIITINTPTQVNGSTDLVLDFNLKGFQYTGGKVMVDLELMGAPAFLTKSRTVRIPGAVSNLSSSGFTLTTKHGGVFSVTMAGNASTINALWSPGSDCGANATLANGDIVAVKGTLDPTTNTITASEVFVHTDSFLSEHGHISGTIASINTSAMSFTLNVQEAVHIQPSGGTVTVQVDSSTVLHSETHSNLDFSGLKVGNSVEVLGAFDTATQTVMACRVEVEK